MVVVADEFTHIAAQLARLRGHGGLRMLVLPFPLEGRPDEEVRRIAEDAYPQLIELLGARD